jgi:hypothetical protein
MGNCYFNSKKILEVDEIFNRKLMLKCGHEMRNGLNIISYTNKIMNIYKNHQCLFMSKMDKQKWVSITPHETNFFKNNT